MGCGDFFVSGAIGEQIWAPTWRFGNSTSIFNIMGIIRRVLFLVLKFSSPLHPHSAQRAHS
ncbi:hypothetical protein, partial [Yersinia enterocolitica]|uniref:hypothetical protein n=1 Tax=Yersinia enterocolitica TaxID=630 RepID=UPI003D028E44